MSFGPYSSPPVDPVAELPTDRSERAMSLRNALLAQCERRDGMDDKVYRFLRREFLTDPETSSLLPAFVRSAHDSRAMWAFLKELDPQWKPRRKFVMEQLAPLIDYLETGHLSGAAISPRAVAAESPRHEKSPGPPSSACPVDISKHHFDVAFSFPGEIRSLVSDIAAIVETSLGLGSTFFDNFYISQLARPSLDVLLQDIYLVRSSLVVVFIGSDYQKKDWCGIELRAIRDIIAKREHERVMFVRFDDGPVDGVFFVDGYVDARQNDAAEIARFIVERFQVLRDSAL